MPEFPIVFQLVSGEWKEWIVLIGPLDEGDGDRPTSPGLHITSDGDVEFENDFFVDLDRYGSWTKIYG